MNPLPILTRELRGADRCHRVLRTRTIAARWAAGIAIALACLEAFHLPVFRWSAPLAFAGIALLASLRPIAIAAGMITTEREQQTLELVFLAGVGPAELFAGKLAGVFVAVGSEVLACLPLLALPFLCGGVSFATFSASILWLPVAVIASISVALLASSLCRDEGPASVGAWAGLGAWCLATPLPWFLGRRLAGATPFDPGWLDFSPAHTAWILYDGLTPANAPHFWRGWTLALIVSAANLVVASFVLSRTWRRIGTGHPRPVSGTTADVRRRGLRREVLAGNPTEWLGLHDARALRQGAWILGAIVAAWIACAIAWPRGALEPLVFLVVLAMLCGVLDTLEAHAVASRVARDRRDGAFELLLTTPATEPEIIDGYRSGPIRLLQPLRRALVGFAAAGLAAGIVAGVFVWRWDGWGIATHAIVCGVGLAWASGWGRPHAGKRAMHAAYVTGRSSAAMTGYYRQGAWGMGWTIYQFVRIANLLRNGAGIPRFPSGGVVECAITTVVALVLVALWAAKRQEYPDGALRDELRRLAPEPVPEPGDPRLKQWQPGQPFG